MLTFCRCLTCLKQDVMYGLLYAALHHGDMIGHICMTDMTSLISFLLILFHSWAAVVVCQQNWVNNTTWNSLTNIFSVHLIQVGSFWVCSRIGVQKCPPPPHVLKICHTNPTMMKLSTAIPYLTKIQNIHKSRETSNKFCWHQYFFTKNQQL